MGEEKRVPLFREKSMQKVASPEQLDDYIRVASPGVWLCLIAIILVLLGFAAWGTLGSVDKIEQENGEQVSISVAPCSFVTN